VADGIERVLRERGWEVDWLSPADLRRVPESRRYPGLNTFLASWAVTRAARRLPQVDLTISHGAFGHGVAGPRLHVYHGTFRGLAEACRAGLPRADYLVLTRLNAWLERQSGRGALRSAVSRAAAEEVERYYGLGGVAVTHNAVDTDHFRPLGSPAGFRVEWRLPQAGVLALVVGRMDFGKGREVVKAMLPSLPAGVSLVFAAPAHSGMDRLPTDRVHLLRGVPYGDLPRLYAACDLVVCPSLYEGFALTPVEAWACGRPVASGAVGVIRELADEAELRPYTTMPGDAAGLAAAVRRLCDDPESRRRQAEWGRALVEKRFAWPRFAAAYAALCESAMARGGATGPVAARPA